MRRTRMAVGGLTVNGIRLARWRVVNTFEFDGWRTIEGLSSIFF